MKNNQNLQVCCVILGNSVFHLVAVTSKRVRARKQVGLSRVIYTFNCSVRALTVETTTPMMPRYSCLLLCFD